MERNNFIGNRLIEWYLIHKRDLPWRNTRDPYKVWISEIILQQTRVNQGFEYYNRFIERFPDVGSLADADEQEVLKYWQGLGYYSRARNLHETSRMIRNNYSGIFPPHYESLLKLKGVGEYTAAAIASFSWNLPHPVVDGNVFRFLSRMFAVNTPIDTPKGKKVFTELAGELMDPDRPGLFNQAIMEFGALQCVPVSPDCSSCPFETQCMANASSSISVYPVKQNKTKTQERYFYYFHICNGNYTYLNQRKGKGIWQHLYEFPMVESDIPLSWKELSDSPAFKQLFPSSENIDFKLIIDQKKHILSHRILYVDFYQVLLPSESNLTFPYLKIRKDEIDHYPTHRLMQFYLEK